MSRRKISAALALAVALVALGACPKKKKAKDQLYFDDIKLPLGAKAKVISDTSMNPPSGGVITVLLAVPRKIDRDDLKQLMKSVFRQIQHRSGFRGSGTAKKIDIRAYGSAAQAKAAGSDWIGQMLRVGVKAKATITNRQKLPLLKYAKKAIGRMPQYSKALKPVFLADPDAMELEVKVPLVADDGSGAYVKKLSYTKVVMTFSGWTRSLFDKIPKLRKLTFSAQHDDKVVLKIWLSRDQYEQLNLRQVEEGIGKFQGKFMNRMLGGNPRVAKMVRRKVAKYRRKVYRAVFARLPKEQVQIAKKYR